MLSTPDEQIAREKDKLPYIDEVGPKGCGFQVRNQGCRLHQGCKSPLCCSVSSVSSVSSVVFLHGQIRALKAQLNKGDKPWRDEAETSASVENSPIRLQSFQSCLLMPSVQVLAALVLRVFG